MGAQTRCKHLQYKNPVVIVGVLKDGGDQLCRPSNPKHHGVNDNQQAALLLGDGLSKFALEASQHSVSLFGGVIHTTRTLSHTQCCHASTIAVCIIPVRQAQHDDVKHSIGPKLAVAGFQ